MQTTSLDILENTQLPSNQARAILQVMELEINAHQGSLATRGDLNDGLLTMKNDLSDAVQMMKRDLNDAVQSLRNEFRSDLNDAIQRLRNEFKNDLNDAVRSLRIEFKNDIKDAVHALELKIERSESRLTRWVFTCMLGQSAMIAGAVYFALTHLRP